MPRNLSAALSQRLTEGAVSPALLRLAWPLMLSNLLQTLYNFTDRFWLARHSSVGIAALALSWPLVFLVLSVGGGVTVAGTALVAQYTGARRTEEANLAAGQVVAFVGSISVILAAVGFFGARPLLALMGADPALTAASAEYLRIIFAGIPAMFGTFVVTALLNGVGDTVTPLWLMGGSVLLNAALDPLLIFGIGPFPEWGIAGAAVATVVARVAMSVIGLSLLFSGRLGVHVCLANLRPRWGLIRRIVAIGGLASVGQTGTALGFAIMNGALARIGTAVLSAFGIGNAFVSIALMPVMGLGQATATMVGQNLGAEKPARARRSAWAGMGWSTLILVSAAAIVLAFRTHLMRVFLSDPEVVAIGNDMLLLVAFAFPFMGVIQVIMGVYQGSGHTGTSTFFDLFRLWALRVPLVYILEFAFGLGPYAVWWAMLASNFGTAVVALAFFLSGSWARRVIRDADARPVRTEA